MASVADQTHAAGSDERLRSALESPSVNLLEPEQVDAVLRHADAHSLDREEFAAYIEASLRVGLTPRASLEAVRKKIADLLANLPVTIPPPTQETSSRSTGSVAEKLKRTWDMLSRLAAQCLSLAKNPEKATLDEVESLERRLEDAFQAYLVELAGTAAAEKWPRDQMKNQTTEARQLKERAAETLAAAWRGHHNREQEWNLRLADIRKILAEAVHPTREAATDLAHRLKQYLPEVESQVDKAEEPGEYSRLTALASEVSATLLRLERILTQPAARPASPPHFRTTTSSDGSSTGGASSHTTTGSSSGHHSSLWGMLERIAHVLERPTRSEAPKWPRF